MWGVPWGKFLTTRHEHDRGTAVGHKSVAKTGLGVIEMRGRCWSLRDRMSAMSNGAVPEKGHWD